MCMSVCCEYCDNLSTDIITISNCERESGEIEQCKTRLFVVFITCGLTGYMCSI